MPDTRLKLQWIAWAAWMATLGLFVLVLSWRLDTIDMRIDRLESDMTKAIIGIAAQVEILEAAIADTRQHQSATLTQQQQYVLSELQQLQHKVRQLHRSDF